MRKNTVKLIAMIALVVLFSFELHGQAKPKKKIIVETHVVNNEFLSGQNIEIKLGITIGNSVDHNLDGLTKLGEKFELLELNSTKPVPIGNEKEYNAVIVTMIIKPAEGLEYGKHEIKGLFIDYYYTEMAWIKDKNDVENLKQLRKTGKETIPTITLEKVPLTAFIANDEGTQEVINISEHTVLKLLILKEKNVEILNNLSPADREKLGLTEATDLENPAMKPFEVISISTSREDMSQYEELTYKYTLALYDISLVKMFTLPSVKVFYRQTGKDDDGEIKSLETPEIKVKTNSVLLENTNFRPMKGSLDKMDSTRQYLLGRLPLLVAKGLLLFAGAVFAWVLLALLLRYLLKAKKIGFVKLLRGSYQNALNRIKGSRVISLWLMNRAFDKLNDSPSNANLSVFIKSVRCHVGNMAKLSFQLAQSLTSRELLEALGRKYRVDNIAVLEIAEYLLDEKTTPEDINVLKKRMLELIAVKKK